MQHHAAGAAKSYLNGMRLILHFFSIHFRMKANIFKVAV
jgi:hypothetical protein